MTSLSRVDQALLLLKDRLQTLKKKDSARSASSSANTQQMDKSGPLGPLRQLSGSGRFSEKEMSRALIRAVLIEEHGVGVVSSLEFQSIADQVAIILEDSESGRELIRKALKELELPARGA